MARSRELRPATDDEYTNEALNREYYDRPCTMSSQSEGCKAYVRAVLKPLLTRSKYRDANWME